METFLRAGLGNAMLATVLALGAASAGCVLRHRPAVRHALWLLVLLKLITPPLWIIPLVSLEPTSSGGPEMVASVVEANVAANLEPAAAAADEACDDRLVGNPWVSNLPRVTLGPVNRARLALAWLAGSLLSLAVTGLRIRRWNRLLRFVEPAPDDVQDGVDILANSMGIAHPPRAYWFPGASAPMLWAFGCRASLIVPCKLWERLDDRQRTTLLVHELAHLRRKDHWVRIVELLATAFYWWLPLAWIARWALREAEEQCCDAWVVWTCPDAHRAYAETLLDTVDFLSETGRTVPLAASGFGHAHHLKRRVTMIMQGTTPRGLSWTGLLAMFGLAALLLPLSPTWAQKADEEERSETDRDVREKVEDPEDSELEVIKRKLAEEIRRLRSLEKETREKAHASAEKARERAKKERSESSEKAGSMKEDADRESAEREHAEKGKDEIKVDGSIIVRGFPNQPIEIERISPKDWRFKVYDPKDKFFYVKDFTGRSEGARARMDGEAVDKELVRAKIEVERARAQLRHAELQLAKLGAELKAKQSESGRRSLDLKDKEEMKAKGRLELHEKPEVQLRDFKFEIKKDLSEEVDKANAEAGRIRDLKIDVERRHKAADLIEKKIRSSAPERFGKIPELEALREKYAESLQQLKRQVRNFDHDPAARYAAEKLEKVLDQLKQLESLNEEKSPKKEREESR